MRIGVPTEIKPFENRIAMVPGGVHALVQDGHEVLIQKDGGLGSGLSNEEYVEAGAKLIDTADELWAQSDMIVKVKGALARGVQHAAARTRRSSPTSTSPRHVS